MPHHPGGTIVLNASSSFSALAAVKVAWAMLTSVVLPNTMLTICTLDSSFCHIALENFAVSGGLENPPLDNCNWIVRSDSDWVARSFPFKLISKKKVCKHQAYAKRRILHALRHTTHLSIFAGTPTDQTVLLHICQSAQIWP